MSEVALRSPQTGPEEQIGAEHADGFHRRAFLEWTAGSLALMNLVGCGRQPEEKIVPAVKTSTAPHAGAPLYFASAHQYAGRAIGVLVESRDGRPTRVDGNPRHPASLGAVDARTQATIRALYDPDRSQSIRFENRVAGWGEVVTALREEFARLRATGGGGLRILTDTVVSPTLGRQLRSLLERYPQAVWHQYDPLHDDSGYEAQTRLFNRSLNTIYRFDRARVVVSLDADFLGEMNGAVAYARQFMSARDLAANPGQMNQLFLAESSVSVTGAAADERIAVTPSMVGTLATALAQRLGVPSLEEVPATIAADSPAAKWLDQAAAALRGVRGESIVIVGAHQPWPVRALAHAINEQLGNHGSTVEFTEPIEVAPIHHGESIAQLAGELDQGSVEVLLVLGSNPVWTAPRKLKFAELLPKVKRMSLHLGVYEGETGRLCQWHVPETHWLESWGDCRSFDGTVAIAQPLINPLFDGKSASELLEACLESELTTALDAVRATWQTAEDVTFERQWKEALHEGVWPSSAAAVVEARPQLPADFSDALAPLLTATKSDAFELSLLPDPCIFDGRFANNAWLQELPKPMTTLTWGNAAFLAPADAEALSVSTGEMVSIEAAGETLELPVLVVKGHPRKSITAYLGHGRTYGGSLANYGVDVYRWFAGPGQTHLRDARVTKAAGRQRLAVAQPHQSIEGRSHEIAQTLTFEQFTEKVAQGAEVEPHQPITLYPDWEYERAWGMTIDLTKCTSCNACVIACQAENNIPVVGYEGVLRGREMHWLRIDQYFLEESENSRVVHQPMMCQHCEHAPCEVVCPVAATSHSSEGLNEMTYNRCVGTRYCSNNCPYKVRRFNFLEYTGNTDPLFTLLYNPDVTVRSRGVMEKCTFCVQRINAARIQASIRASHDGQPLHIPDGEVVTACQAACPSQAINFGDLKDSQSDVHRLSRQPHGFGVLAELGTRPRVTYLAKVFNTAEEASA